METECEVINRGLAPPSAPHSAGGGCRLSLHPPKARGHSGRGGGRDPAQEGQAEDELLTGGNGDGTEWHRLVMGPCWLVNPPLTAGTPSWAPSCFWGLGTKKLREKGLHSLEQRRLRGSYQCL